MDAIVRALQSGVSLRTALTIANISRSCFYEWQRRFPAFAEAVEQAEASAIAHLERTAFELALYERSERMVQWLLERRCPEVYSPKQQSPEGYHIEVLAPPDDGSVPYEVHLRNGVKP